MCPIPALLCRFSPPNGLYIQFWKLYWTSFRGLSKPDRASTRSVGIFGVLSSYKATHAKPKPICDVHLQQSNRRSANRTSTDNKDSVALLLQKRAKVSGILKTSLLLQLPCEASRNNQFGRHNRNRTTDRRKSVYHSFQAAFLELLASRSPGSWQAKRGTISIPGGMYELRVLEFVSLFEISSIRRINFLNKSVAKFSNTLAAARRVALAKVSQLK